MTANLIFKARAAIVAELVLLAAYVIFQILTTNFQ